MLTNRLRTMLIALSLPLSGTTACQGEPGPRGVDGLDGDRGPQGYPGAGYDQAGAAAQHYRPLGWVGCTASLDLVSLSAMALGQDGVDETGLNYTVTAFSNGDLDVSCDSSIGSAQSGAGGRYFPATLAGAQDGSCQSYSDYPPTGAVAGYWGFSIEEGGPRATYSDEAGHPLLGRVYAFTDSDCTALRLDDSDEWSRISLGSVFSQ